MEVVPRWQVWAAQALVASWFAVGFVPPYALPAFAYDTTPGTAAAASARVWGWLGLLLSLAVRGDCIKLTTASAVHVAFEENESTQC